MHYLHESSTLTRGGNVPNADAQPIRVLDTSAGAAPFVWSPSSLNMFLQCPLSFWWRHHQGWRGGSSAETLAGDIVHAVLEELMRLPSPDRTHSATWTLLNRTLAGRADLAPRGTEFLNTVTARAHDAIATYLLIEDPTHSEPVPGGVERTIDGHIAGEAFMGRIDLAEVGMRGLIIKDYKTGAYKPRYTAPHWRQQLIYATLMGQQGTPVAEVHLLYLGNPPGHEWRPVTSEDIGRVHAEVSSAADQRRSAIDSQIWAARPSGLCARCSFWAACPAVDAQVPAPASADSNRILKQVGLRQRESRSENP